MLLSRSRPKRHINHEGSWAVSYVDMLTLLLCLFIIFYSAEKVRSSNPDSASPIIKLASQLSGAGAGTGALNSPTNSATAGQGNGGNSAEKEAKREFIQSIQTVMSEKFNIESIRKDDMLEIQFRDISFFASGSVKLNSEAKQEIETMIRAMEPYKDSVHITVQGHTDPTPVSVKRSQFSDNWELSVIRATSVLKLFLANQYDQNSLSAEGFADTRAHESIENKESRDTLRKVTLRVEPKRDWKAK